MGRLFEAFIDIVSAPDDPARARAEARLEQIRSISRAAMQDQLAPDREVVEFAATTKLLGDIALVHPHQISEAAEDVQRLSNALLEGAIPEIDRHDF